MMSVVFPVFAAAWRHFLLGSMATLTYRWNLFQMLVGEAIGTVGLTLFWYKSAISSFNKTYSPAQIVVYFVLATMLATVSESGINANLSLDIRGGKIYLKRLQVVSRIHLQTES